MPLLSISKCVRNQKEFVYPLLISCLSLVPDDRHDCHDRRKFDDPDDHVETPIFFSVAIVTIRIAAIVEIETNSISTIMGIKCDDQVTIENLMETTSLLDLTRLQNGIFRIS